MPFQPFPRLLAAAGAAHLADQLALAALPLVAAVALGAGPGLVGALVALQGAAWLLVSLPAGVVVDAGSKPRLLAAAQAGAGFAFLAAMAASAWGGAPALGLAAFLGASGAVVFVLAAMALVPDLVGRADLPRANARLELARAVAALGAPVAAGLLAEGGHAPAAFGIAGAAALVAAALAWSLRGQEAAAPSVAKPPVLVAIREGAAFAWSHDLLRGIVLCAVFWNFAFFALMAVFVPFALTRIGLEPSGVGLVQAGYGGGLILGALAAGPALARFAPRVILAGGPALSALAAVLMLAAPVWGAPAAFAAFFLIGFGPMLWLICQTSIRQLVTPPALLGRVAALIQVAIYGVRPLGALAGGLMGERVGLDAAMTLVLAAFLASLAVPALSALGRLGAMPEAAR